MQNELCIHSLYADDELYHHGIMGMKWGVRRYQNPDGSYTDAGRKRYGIGSERKSAKQLKKFLNDNDQYIAYNKSLITRADNAIKSTQKRLEKASRKGKTKKVKKIQGYLLDQKSVRNKALSDLASAQKAQDELLEFAKEHYNVKVKDILRDTKTKGERAGTVFWGLYGGAVGGAIAGGLSALSPGASTYGSKYKVKDLKEGAMPKFTDKRKYHGDSPTDKKIQDTVNSYNERVTNHELKQRAGDSIVSRLNSNSKGWKIDTEADMNDVSITKPAKLKNGKQIQVSATVTQDHYGETNEKNVAKQIRAAYNNVDKVYKKAIDALVDDAYEWYGKREGLTKAEIRKGFSDDGGVYVYPSTSANNKSLSSGMVTVWAPNIAGGHVGEVEFGIDNKGNVKTYYPSFQG